MSQPRWLGDHPGGVLPGREGAVGEVPQRSLPRARLVDALRAGVAEPGQEGVVRGGHDPPEHHQLAVEQLTHGSRAGHDDQLRVRRYPLERGHRWPSASIGPPQKGHGARPAATTDSARAAKDRAIAGGHPHQQHLLGLRLLDRQVDQLLLRGLDRELHLDLDDREHLDDHPLVVGVPGQRDRAGPELLLDRLVQRLVVDQADRRHRRDRGLRRPRSGSARPAARRPARPGSAPAASPGRPT